MSKYQLFLWEGVAVRIVEDPHDYELAYLTGESLYESQGETGRDIRRMRIVAQARHNSYAMMSRIQQMHERINQRGAFADRTRGGRLLFMQWHGFAPDFAGMNW